MRPRRLHVEGFAAFRDPVVIDFTGADYFALVGPTGSGKSSVLDAICFALYGSVPRYDNEKLVAPALTQGALELRVGLEFEVDGVEHVATRVVRRTKAGASTKEARLERGSEVLAGDARSMTAAVETLLGLSFSQFTRCVLLPQSEFARFLHDKPSERQGLLVSLLDLGVYGRMRERANELAAAAKAAIALDERRLADLADCTPEARAEATARVAALGALRTRLADAGPTVAALSTEVERAAAAAERVKQVVDQLARVELSELARQRATERAAAAAALDAARAAHSRAGEELDAVEARLGALPDPSVLDAWANAHERAAQLATERTALATEIETAEAAQRDAADAHAAADARVWAAQADHDHAVANAGADAIAATLVAGEPCPVCHQTVHEVRAVEPGAVDAARAALTEARRAADAARDVEQRATTALATARRRRDDLERDATVVAAGLEAAPDAATVAAQRAAVREAEQARRAARTAEQTARATLGEAEATLAQAEQRLVAAREHADGQRDALVALGLEPPTLGADLVEAWTVLETWARAQVDAQRARHAELVAEVSAGRERIAAALAELVAATGATGVAVAPDAALETLREAVAGATARAEEAVVRIDRGLEERGRLAAAIEAQVVERDVASALGGWLRSNRFEQWLVNEALQRLVVSASETLEVLSGGQYALAVDDGNEFEVVDHRNADERRPARTLSGGETFQASLALALALASEVGAMASNGAARLDSIFLDEGFGTLDPDSLDTVAATLETLGSDGRMVGIVTHVRDLAERVPVRFEIEKGPRTSTARRVEA